MASKLNFLARPGRLVAIIDKEWQKETLPNDDILVPQDEMPDPDAESGPPPATRVHETAKDMEKKWNDLGIMQIVANSGPKKLQRP